jgi:hypothetical protein
MKRTATIIIEIIVTILFITSCGRPPLVDVDADYVLVGFEDNYVIALDKDMTEFKEIADEAIRVYQYSGLPTECYFGSEEIERIKLDNRFVEIGFDEAIDVPTSQNVNDLEIEIRDNLGRKTTEEGYIISELISALFTFSGEYEGLVLYRPDERYPVWYCFKSSRGFSKLERMANTYLTRD